MLFVWLFLCYGSYVASFYVIIIIIISCCYVSSEDACALLSDAARSCDQICMTVVNGGQPVCRCEDGYTLNSDGISC